MDIKQSTAVTVLIGPFLDDTDGVTPETVLTIAQADVRLSKNGGNMAQKSDATSCTHDELGYYTCPLNTTDTDTLGALMLMVSESGALPVWNQFNVLEANAYDSKYGTTLQDTNIVQISGDATAADNLELQYDTTGLSGDTFPATQAQLGNIANTGAAINTVAIGGTLNTGTEVGAYTDTQALDLVYNVISPSAGAFSKDYNFNIGGTGVPVSVSFSGRLFDPAPTNDSIVIQVYDWVGAAWVQVGTLDGVNSAVDSVKTVILFANMVGTGANSGEVDIRFLATAIDAATDLYIDLLYCSFSVVSSAVGYANGAIWIDTINGTSGAVANVNGTADNPSDNEVDALTLAGLIGLSRFEIGSNSLVTLFTDATGLIGTGEQWDLELAGQIVTNASVVGANVTGLANSGSTNSKFTDCHIGACSLTPSHMTGCGIIGPLTLLGTGSWSISSSHSEIAGSATPVLDFNGVGAKAVNIRNYSGGMEIQNMKAGDTMSFEGRGQLIVNANCSGGAVAIRGLFSTSGAGLGNLTITEDARYNDSKLTAALDEEIGDGTITIRESLRGMIAILLGESSGGGTATITFRNDADTQNVQVATVDANGNRTATTFTP